MTATPHPTPDPTVDRAPRLPDEHAPGQRPGTSCPAGHRGRRGADPARRSRAEIGLIASGGGLRLVALVVGCVLASLGAVAVVGRLWDLITLLVVCTVLACCLEPAVESLTRRGVKRSAAAGLVLVGALAAAVGMVVAVGAAVTAQAVSVVDQVPDMVDQVASWAHQYGVDIQTSKVVSVASSFGTGLLSRTLSGLLTVVTGLLIVYYLLADGPRLRRAVCSVLPPARQVVVLKVWEVAIDRAGRYLMVRVVLSLAASVFTGVVLYFLHVPNAIALSIWVGLVSQLVPVVGTYLAMALPLLVAAVDGSAHDVVVIAIALVAYQQVENFVLSPKLSGRALNVHPALALIGVLAGSRLMGASGAVIAMPVLATVSAVVSTYLHRHELITDALLGNHEPGDLAPDEIPGDEIPGDETPDDEIAAGTTGDDVPST